MTFYETITAAVRDIIEHGFDSQDRIERWMETIKAAAIGAMISPLQLEKHLQGMLTTVYTRLIERGTILTRHPGISRFTLEHVKPKLRGELDRRIMASANLIKLNRQEAVEKTLRRFSGWSTSIPAGGSTTQDKPEVKANVSKALKQLPFEERRVLIDQGHKFTSSLNNILANDAGALAAVWHSNWRQLNYNYRVDHKERDEHVYAIKGSWAQQRGFVKVGKNGWFSDITQPAEEPFCRCFASYIYALKKLPDDMLTQKGRDEILRIKAELAAA